MSRAALALLALAACMPRVTLPPLPAADAPPEERRAAQLALTPIDPPEPYYSKSLGLQLPKKPYPFLVLGNGSEIFDPRDLLSAVYAGSSTADSIKRYDDRSYFGRIGLLASLGLFLIGSGVALDGLINRSNPQSSTLTGVGLGVTVAGMLTGMFSAIVYLTSRLALADAFTTYPADLAAALGVPLIETGELGSPAASAP